MGQFTERYEKLQTWAVLPGEPFVPENDVDRLDAAPAASPTDLGGGAASLSIILAPAEPPVAADPETRD